MTEFVAPHFSKINFIPTENTSENKTFVAQPLKHVPSYYVLLEANGSLCTIVITRMTPLIDLTIN